MATTHTAKLTEGSPVCLADREPNAADSKSGLYYPYYRNLTGIIAKLYADDTATVTIDPESLPSEIRARHQAGTEAMRQKWLDGLSDEARNKLSASEKKFALRYNLLVGLADLSPGQALPAPAPALAAPAPAHPAPSAKRGQEVAQASLDMDDLPATPRKSLEELDADEARYLAERAAKKDS